MTWFYKLPLLFDYYTVFYPLIMSTFTIIGSILFYYFSKKHTIPALKDHPKVSLVIPAFNEECLIQETIQKLEEIDYPNIDFIIVDDCSTDNTVQLINEMIQKKPHLSLTLITKKRNAGKAHSLNRALNTIKTDYLVVLDADAILDSQAITELMKYHQHFPKAGAVTGKPIVRNRSTILGKLQTLEYSCTIDCIKKSQAYFYNALLTVSGVLVMYKVSALKEVGGFDTHAMTEDIDITWRMYKSDWSVHYNAHAFVFILVPEKITNLFKQRRRWAVGGLETYEKNILPFIKKKRWSFFVLLSEIPLSYLWTWSVLLSFTRYLLLYLFTQNLSIPGAVTFLFSFLSILMFLISLLDRQKNYLTFSDIIVIPIQLMFYWLINIFSSFTAGLDILTNTKRDGTWNSPDRGI